MRLLDFFKAKIAGIFVSGKVDGGGAFDNTEVDYVLSRSLYASAPADGSGYMQYALGNYCTKTYIDTFSSFIGVPDVSAASDTFTQDLQAYFSKHKKKLLSLYRQAMIDGSHYLWCRIEKDIRGNAKLQIKQVLIEHVLEDECIKRADGSYEKFVMQHEEIWQEGSSEKKTTVKTTLTANKETITFTRGVPPSYQHLKTTQTETGATAEITNKFNFVPVFCLYNNKLPFMKSGIPEIAAAVPFIRRYDAVLRSLGKHIDYILDPKMKARIENIGKFMQHSLGLSNEELTKVIEGKSSRDITQFKIAILSGKDDDVEYITQPDYTMSAVELLKLLHWIIIELTMPEYLYGTAMNSTNASVQEQSPVWAKKIEDRQSSLNEFYYWLTDVFYLASVAIHGRDIYASDGGSENITIHWAELAAKDDVQMMSALGSFVSALDTLMMAGLLSPQSAFNTLKTFIAIPNDYETEKEAAESWIAFKLKLENIQERMRSGDEDMGDALSELFNKAG